MNRMKSPWVCVVFALGGWATGMAFAQSGADALSACTSLKNEKARLKCYDEQMAKHGRAAAASEVTAAPSAPEPVPAASAASAAPTAPASAAARAPATPAAAAAPAATPHADSGSALSPEDEFGLAGEALRKKRQKQNAALPPDEISARVKAVSRRAWGEHLIELENGQFWVETRHMGREPPATGETVRIRRGVLGAYYLEREHGAPLKVKRLE